jgi:site-specific DNA-methyltransferase (adenine-specific)
MKEMPEASVDAIVTDPPYGINFMGKEWDGPGGMLGQIATGKEKRGAFAYGGSRSRDYADNDNTKFQEWCLLWATELLRVLKPGGHILAFGGTRTHHRLACGIEDAGFEVRDQIQWLYGSGFPKSMNVGKAIDKRAGKKRKVVGKKKASPKGISAAETRSETAAGSFGGKSKMIDVTAPATDAAARWEGWGTALKPANEPIVVARKPFKGTVAENVQEYGTGAINIDACRINTTETITNHSRSSKAAVSKGKYGDSKQQKTHQTPGQQLGRWPANVILDPEAGAMLDEQSGREASRFFYCPKASKAERTRGARANAHPTVKPIDLMRYLVRLVTPPGGTVLDPFTGSGTTGIAAGLEGFDFIGIEREPEYCEIAEARLKWWASKDGEAEEPLTLFGKAA